MSLHTSCSPDTVVLSPSSAVFPSFSAQSYIAHRTLRPGTIAMGSLHFSELGFSVRVFCLLRRKVSLMRDESCNYL